MKIINLRLHYPHCQQDKLVEVSEEVFDVLCQSVREMRNYERRRRYHRAYYSLDAFDWTENYALEHSPSPEQLVMLAEEQAERDWLAAALREALAYAIVSRQHIEDAVSAVLMILPFTAILCMVISVLFALAYSRMFTRPIQQISAATEKMRELEPDAHCPNDTQDEMGMLADNVNSLYQTLLSTIQTLEQEIEKVEAADIQKSNFLRAASHELKTPVTAVSVMLENMLLGIGKYKDRDTYLARCKELTDQLAQMIKEILDASRAEFAGEQEQTDFLIADALNAVIEPYQIIAKAKGIAFSIDVGEPFTVHLPQGMIEKAISNILANAVSYTKPDGTIYVSCKGWRLIIENECTPIPPEHLAHIFEPFYRPDY